MKYLIILLALSCQLTTAKQIKIAVLDTGFTRKNNPTVHICPNGLIDLTNTSMMDDVGHASNVIGLIEKQLDGVDYCMYVIKVYSRNGLVPNYLNKINLDVNIINFSSVGPEKNFNEAKAIKRLQSHGVLFVSAAGNNGYNLDEKCRAYPACLPGVVAVGSLDIYGQRSKFSNYGQIITHWQIGEVQCAGGYCKSGTSQSTAIETGKLAKKLSKEK